MSNIFALLLSQVELITIILVFVKWKFQYKDFFYFKIYVLYGYLADQIGHILLLNLRNKLAIIDYNLYVLISTILIVLYLKAINIGKLVKTGLILFSYSIIWVIDNFILNDVTTTNSICRITAHILVVLLSFNTIKQRIELYNFNIKNEPVFIIVIGLIFNSIYKIIYEIIYLIGNENNELNMAISFLIPIINFILYSFYTYALLCLKRPTKLISHF